MEVSDSTMRCALEEMPDEILLAIITHLEITRGFAPDPDDDSKRQVANRTITSTLHSLSLTSRRLARVATPFLYRCFVQDRRNLDATILLLRTLTVNLELARHLHYFETLTSRVREHEISLYSHECNLVFLTKAIAGAKWADVNMKTPYERNYATEHKGWRFADSEQRERYLWEILNFAKTYHPYLFATIAVAMLAGNLSELATWDQGHLMTALSFKDFHGGPKTLWLKNSDWLGFAICTIQAEVKPNGHSGTLQDYLRADRNSDASVLYLKHHGSHVPASTFTAELQNMSLDVYDCEMEYFANRLEPCQSLRHFSCRWVGHPSLEPAQAHPGRPTKTIDLPGLRQALDRFSTCLESLKIDTLDSEWQISDSTDIPALGSLRNFTALKDLDLSGIVLFGDYDNPDIINLRLALVLPCSLEILKIRTEWDDDIEEALHMLLPECSSLLPSLKKIICDWRPAPKPIADYLTEAFKGQGVDLILGLED